jgi:hypothetical protein
MLTDQLKRFLLALVVLLTICQAQTGANWNEKTLTPYTAEAFLEATLHGEKKATITGVIANTDFKNVSLGTSCRSSSSGSIDGKVNDNGNVSGEVKTTGSTSCQELHDYYYWIDVAYADNTNSAYIITARCDVRWVWNHCALPEVGDKDGMVIAREKKVQICHTYRSFERALSTRRDQRQSTRLSI